MNTSNSFASLGTNGVTNRVANNVNPDPGADGGALPWADGRPDAGAELDWKVRPARDRTKRTIQIGVRSEFLESKENYEKHRREKNHFNEAAFDPSFKIQEF